MTAAVATHDENGVRDIGHADPNYRSRYRVVYRSKKADEERILYSAQERQDELHACTAPNILYGGAAGGGKSHAARWHGIISCCRRAGLKVLLLRRQFKELENTHLLELPKELPKEIARYHASLKRLIFPHKRERGGDSILQFGHCQHEKDVASYLSTQWDLIIVDEASEFTPRMLSMLQSRLRTKLEGVRPQLVLCSNPGGEAHLWLLARFIEKRVDPKEDGAYDPGQYHFILARVGDNRHNDAHYLTRLLSLPEALREAYLYGNWHAFAGQYFREWAPTLHTLPLELDEETGLPLGIEEWHEIQAGMDWGYDPHPGVVLWAAFDTHGRPTLYKELKFDLSSPREVAEMIVARCTTEGERNMIIYGDSQMWERSPQNKGVSIADEINNRFSELGVGIVLVQANKDRLNGWIRVHQFLDVRRPRPEGGHGPYLRIVSDQDKDGRRPKGEVTPLGCPYLIQTLPAQMHDEKASGDMKKSGNDHAVDTLRYLLMAREPLSTIPKDKLGHPSHANRIRARTAQLLEKAKERRLELQKAEVMDADGLDVDETEIDSPEYDEDGEIELEGDGDGDLWS